MNIYTKTGDKGKTSLFDNKRVSKDSIRVESYGTVDELVSILGLAKNFIDDEKMYKQITEIQNKLFIVGATLATEDPSKVPHEIKEEDIIDLERAIDEYMGKVKKPTGFIVPGSGKASGFLHVSRTICRRAERRIISLSEIARINPLVLKYVNRLSDLIYAMGRVLEEKEEKVKYGE